METLSALSYSSRQPAEGYLRAHKSGELSGKDVIVMIAPAEQLRLVELLEDSPVDIVVQIAQTAIAGTFDPQRSYVALDSSGVRVDVESIRPNGGRTLHIVGTKRGERDLDKE